MTESEKIEIGIEDVKFMTQEKEYFSANDLRYICSKHYNKKVYVDNEPIESIYKDVNNTGWFYFVDGCEYEVKPLSYFEDFFRQFDFSGEAVGFWKSGCKFRFLKSFHIDGDKIVFESVEL